MTENSNENGNPPIKIIGTKKSTGKGSAKYMILALIVALTISAPLIYISDDNISQYTPSHSVTPTQKTITVAEKYQRNGVFEPSYIITEEDETYYLTNDVFTKIRVDHTYDASIVPPASNNGKTDFIIDITTPMEM